MRCRYASLTPPVCNQLYLNNIEMNNIAAITKATHSEWHERTLQL